VDRDATSAQVRLLGEMLGRAISEVEGQEELELVERVRALAIASRNGDQDAGAELLSLLRGIPAEEAMIVVSAFAAWFHLINLAEDQALVRQLILDRQQPRPRMETCPRRSGPPSGVCPTAACRARSSAALLDQVAIRPVMTAHPTESKRRTVLTKLGRVSTALRRLDQESLSPEVTAELERYSGRRSPRCGSPTRPAPALPR
jgi:phosphoenolpyruvate carboxylase